MAYDRLAVRMQDGIFRAGVDAPTIKETAATAPALFKAGPLQSLLLQGPRGLQRL